jgi:alkylation response protein AidB-like acyl-CoA dehydrogenase
VIVIVPYLLKMLALSDGILAAILVERDTPGFTIEPLAGTMGCKGGEHGRLTFNDVCVPAGNILGEEGRGLERWNRCSRSADFLSQRLRWTPRSVPLDSR